MNKTIIILAFMLLSGCATSGYKEFYEPYTSANNKNLVPLKPNEQPLVHKTNDLAGDLRKLRSKKYVIIGASSFNGAYDDGYVKQAIDVGATLVVVKADYTDTQSSTSNLLIPSTTMTTSSGSGVIGSSNVIYNGTSTTTGLTAIPMTSNQRRYDQVAYFLVKSNAKIRYGISSSDLTPEKRKEIGRNTGALVELVFEDSPAFYADIIEGDVITHVDGVKTLNSSTAIKQMKNTSQIAKTSTLSIIRNKKEMDIVVTFL